MNGIVNNEIKTGVYYNEDTYTRFADKDIINISLTDITDNNLITIAKFISKLNDFSNIETAIYIYILEMLYNRKINNVTNNVIHLGNTIIDDISKHLNISASTIIRAINKLTLKKVLKYYIVNNKVLNAKFILANQYNFVDNIQYTNDKYAIVILI